MAARGRFSRLGLPADSRRMQVARLAVLPALLLLIAAPPPRGPAAKRGATELARSRMAQGRALARMALLARTPYGEIAAGLAAWPAILPK